MLLLLALTAASSAAAPDRFAASVSGSASAAIDLVPGPDGLALIFADPSGGQLATLDLRTWSISTVDACSGAAGVALWDDGSETRVYTGCSDGSVVYAVLEDGLLGDVSDPVDVADGEVLALVEAGELLYVLTDPEDGANPRFHSLDPATDSVDGQSGYPSTTNYTGFEDVEATDTQAFVLHGGDNLSKLTFSGGAVASDTNAVGVLEARDLVLSSTGSSILAGGGAAVARFSTGDNEWTLALGEADGLDEVDSLQILEGEELLAVADGVQAELLLFDWFSSSGAVGDDLLNSLAWPDSTAVVEEMAVVLEDYLVAGTDSGELWVATGRPWVELTSTSTATAVVGDVVDLEFESDTDGDYRVLLGATDNDSGTELTSGTITAGTTASVSVEVTEDYAEGDNYLRVVVDDGTLEGHDSAVVTIDNPPSKISLSDSSVGVAEGYLTLSFTAPSDEDLDTVTVYISTTSFQADDWPTGGPDFDGSDALSAPIEVQPEPSEAVEVVISPLTNGTTYYMAVRATDSGGLEGPMSTVVSGTPEETYGVAELSGEEGGFCGAAGGVASLWLTGLGGLLALGRRRRWAGAALALGLVGLSSGSAWAQDDPAPLPDPAAEDPAAEDPAAEDPAAEDPAAEEGAAEEGAAEEAAGEEGAEVLPTVVVEQSSSGPTEDEVEAAIEALPSVEELISDEDRPRIRSGVTARFGPMWFDEDSPIVAVLGESGHNVLWLEGGPVFWRVLQVSAGAGFYRKKGTLLTESGDTSTQDDILWSVPVTGNLGLRLDVIKDQPLVPFASVGADYWFWRESWSVDSEGTRTGVGGGKAGYHYAVGGEILLDFFEPGRADTIDARAGIRDSYLVVEYRHQEVGLFTDGLDLSNNQLTFGIRLHH